MPVRKTTEISDVAPWQGTLRKGFAVHMAWADAINVERVRDCFQSRLSGGLPCHAVDAFPNTCDFAKL